MTNPFSSSVPLRGFKITSRTTASNLRHEPPCTRVHYPAFFFPSSREILLSTIRRFVPFSFPSPLLFPLQLIFLSRALDFLPREPFGLLPPGIFLPVGPASRHFGRTNYCFPSYFAPAMHRRDSRDAVAVACSCAAVIFDHVEQRARGSRRMLPRLFVRALSSSSSPSRPPSPPRYCSARVFRTFALFACMVIWNAPRVPKRCGTTAFVALFLFTLEVGQFHRTLCSLKPLFLFLFPPLF